jgi:hypothetical protein
MRPPVKRRIRQRVDYLLCGHAKRLGKLRRTHGAALFNEVYYFVGVAHAASFSG